MVGPSKILTVSYGTFSCTLEGFDNPFSTMRGLAEYFRDLAADDRYFGAEPPIPDADMLHRIAQGEAKKRVITHMDTNGVTLRQLEDEDISQTTASPVVAQAPGTQVSDPFVDEPADIKALNESSRVQSESVAAKLARLRAVDSDDGGAEDTGTGVENDVFASAPISAAFNDAEAEAELAEPVTAAPETAGPETAAPVETRIHRRPEPETEAPSVSEDSGDAVSQDDGAQTDNADIASAAQFMGDAEQAEVSDDTENLDDPDGSSITRVVRMRRSDFDAPPETDPQDAVQEDAVQDTAELPEDFEEDQERPVSSLSEEDEAELMANLAAVQRKASAEERSEKEGRALLENRDDIKSNGEAVSRILDVTNTELEETEGTRRRSAIAHLKAAVAATRADTNIKSQREQEDADELGQYRDDLAKIVRPRRAEAKNIRANQAPLMLVSEQRIEEPAEETLPESDVQPRRVISEDVAKKDSDQENLFVENYPFAKFAQEMGAVELTDQLEAAAAYSAYVQGQAHFSRPQIMQAVATINDSDYSREENLRAFGMLLRRGKIKKLTRGQFTVAETTRFRPHENAVGQ